MTRHLLEVDELAPGQLHHVLDLADLPTIRQELRDLEGRTVAFVGDAHTVAHSLATGAGIGNRTSAARGLLACVPGA